eukprot:TRINITY_DN6902_c0_g1_i2.p1 TRINITY_DN6902_c0_g1~~TRINITY_DN6902_c0_g1_i2.p1  ORF type:complete len:174 (+),score=38.99 TRINITY_DN6902_c0_g1_i2:39-560(+)
MNASPSVSEGNRLSPHTLSSHTNRCRRAHTIGRDAAERLLSDDETIAQLSRVEESDAPIDLFACASAKWWRQSDRIFALMRVQIDALESEGLVLMRMLMSFMSKSSEGNEEVKDPSAEKQVAFVLAIMNYIHDLRTAVDGFSGLRMEAEMNAIARVWMRTPPWDLPEYESVLS